ncbi:Carboxypeptidase S1-like protein [Lachnellula occidentalis]|uniref:Carboxypeptidase S1-like protein n=1 Tax=Lachnellula occidentalis TaxID=215460 RepID=A0A8H8UK96_9HELO|nr:Carboxypeptidase S1-like protein [Lachnellula occidentalis]
MGSEMNTIVTILTMHIPLSLPTLLALTLLPYSSLAQFVPAPTDLLNATGYAGIPVRYKEVPTGICELDPNVKSYAGYADVDEDQHIFFWFFESRKGDAETAPLTVSDYGCDAFFDWWF